MITSNFPVAIYTRRHVYVRFLHVQYNLILYKQDLGVVAIPNDMIASNSFYGSNTACHLYITL